MAPGVAAGDFLLVPSVLCYFTVGCQPVGGASLFFPNPMNCKIQSL